MSRTCPEDGTALNPETHFGVQLDICPECGGVWFDDGELLAASHNEANRMRALDASIPAHQKTDSPAFKKCPADGATMEEFAYLYATPIRLDSCPACFGIWVQDGELAAMAAALEEAEKDRGDLTAEHQAKVVAMMAEHNEMLSRHQIFQRVIGFFSIRRRTLF